MTRQVQISPWKKVLSANCWIFDRWKLQLLTIENGSVVFWVSGIMIELMWLISWDELNLPIDDL